MKKLTSFQHFHNDQAEALDVILHGGSKGIESPFIQKLFESSKNKGHSVITFNFSYIERGEENPSGAELKEELETLTGILQHIQHKNYSHIRLIGKSLGGIVASYYLNTLNKDPKNVYEIIVLGYITGAVMLKSFEGKITIIQGEQDKFGNIKQVKRDLKNASSQKITYYQIPNADHSYRNPETKEPLYEDQVIAILESI